MVRSVELQLARYRMCSSSSRTYRKRLRKERDFFYHTTLSCRPLCPPLSIHLLPSPIIIHYHPIIPTTYPPLATHHHPPSTVYSPIISHPLSLHTTIHHPPSITLLLILSTVLLPLCHCPPSTIHYPLSTTNHLPSTTYGQPSFCCSLPISSVVLHTILHSPSITTHDLASPFSTTIDYSSITHHPLLTTTSHLSPYTQHPSFFPTPLPITYHHLFSATTCHPPLSASYFSSITSYTLFPFSEEGHYNMHKAEPLSASRYFVLTSTVLHPCKNPSGRHCLAASRDRRMSSSNHGFFHQC